MSYRYDDSKYFNPSLYGLEKIECGVRELINQASYLEDEKKQQLVDCCFFAAQAHLKQKRRSGEPYICHPLKVAEILAREVRFGLTVLQAAVLHDVIEDTDVQKPEIEAIFGAEIANLVDGVSKLEKEKGLSRQELQARTFEKLVHAMEADPRVVMIKFADRMHNMQTLGALKPDARRRIAQETLDVYVPIASRLGMFVFKTELEELVFKQVHPWRYDVFRRVLEGSEAREETVQTITGFLQDVFQELNISASIRRRRRSLYSIYKKVQKSHFNSRRPLEHASIPFIILTENVDDCYRILGLVHRFYTPVFHKLADYIASPKANGYQSIHTSVLTGDRRVVNFQIRTKAMHAVAESGIIAIWRYHNQVKNNPEKKVLSKDKPMRRWLENIKFLSDLATTPVEFYEEAKRDLADFDMHVLTPKGEPIGLPRGASVIDFAYHVHPDVGNRLERVKVNGVDVPLDYQLSDGQTVEAFTSPHARPCSAWLDCVVTARARAAVRHYLRDLPDDELSQIGYEEIERFLSDKGLKYRDLEKRLSKLAKTYPEVGTLAKLLQKVALCELEKNDIMRDLQNSIYQGGIFSSITVEVVNKLGVIAVLSETIAEHEADISRIRFPENIGVDEVFLVFELHLPCRLKLDVLLDSLRQLDVVKNVKNEEIV